MGLAATGGFYSALSAFKYGRPYYSIYPMSSSFISELATQDIELLTASPLQVRDMLLELKAQNTNLRSVKLVRLAGSSAPTALLEEISLSMPGAEIEILYGSTEGGGVTRKIYRTGEKPADVGLPIAGVNIEITDDLGQVCEKNKPGAVRYKTPGLIVGYLNNQEATGKQFRGGWFYPGDHGYIDDRGHLILSGRDGDYVNLGGENQFSQTRSTSRLISRS